MFCSFVSLLRYVRINGIDYSFLNLDQYVFKDDDDNNDNQIDGVTISDLGINGNMIQLKNRTLQINFKDEFDTLKPMIGSLTFIKT